MIFDGLRLIISLQLHFPSGKIPPSTLSTQWLLAALLSSQATYGAYRFLEAFHTII